MFLKESLPIQNKIMLLIVSLVSVTLIVAGIFFERGIIPSFEEKQALHAKDIAYTVSQMPLVKEMIDKPNHKSMTQPILDDIIKGTNIKLILLIGGPDAQPVIEGHPFSTIPEVTTFGPIVRAYLPVFRDGAKVGAVAVYLWSRDIKIKMWELRKKIILAVAFGLFLGTFFAHLLSRNIKKTMFGMEPYQIAALLKEREAFLETVREGIIAIDKTGKIMFVNRQAKEILKVPESEIMTGCLIEKYVPNSRLRRVLASGEPEYDREQNLEGARIFTNRIPIRSGDKILGAIASFRKADEIQSLAEELTGARKMAEVLKVQNELLRVHKHEYLNKLHAISGSLQMGDCESALRLIHCESDSQQEIMEKIHNTIKQPEIAGLLIGKISRSKELGVDLQLDERSTLKKVSSVDVNSLIVCLGNLIENATESVQEPSAPGKNVSVLLEHTDGELVIEVTDTGVGIPAENRPYIFEKAFSNKSGGKRGYGLFLVRSVVVSYGGSVDFESTVGKGTRFRIIFPEAPTHE